LIKKARIKIPPVAHHVYEVPCKAMCGGLGVSRKLGAVLAVVYLPAGSYKPARPQQRNQMKCIPQQRAQGSVAMGQSH
jgi:hypothetical protein